MSVARRSFLSSLLLTYCSLVAPALFSSSTHFACFSLAFFLSLTRFFSFLSPTPSQPSPSLLPSQVFATFLFKKRWRPWPLFAFNSNILFLFLYLYLVVIINILCCIPDAAIASLSTSFHSTAFLLLFFTILFCHSLVQVSHQ